MNLHDPRQKIALTGIVSALFFSASFIYICALYLPFSMPTMESPIDKLLFAWKNALFAAFPLVCGLVAVLVQTLLRPAALDGGLVQGGAKLEIHLRFVRDTAAHLVLFVIMLCNLSVSLGGELLRFIPSVTSWFIFARLYFWAAYLISPPQRMFGTVATLAPTVFFMAVAAVRTLGLV